MRVLVVDDEPDVASLVRMGIAYQRPEYEVVESHSGADALGRAAREPWDLVILDLTMPEPDGFTVLGALRAASDVPIIVLTARDAEQDRVRGLELGADDYVTKPFSQKELVARIDAVMRRYRAGAEATHVTELVRGDLRIDFAQRKVSVRGQPVALTPTEYNLLFQLSTNRGKVMTHRELLKQVWGDEYREEVHYLKVYVGRLRTKLERDPGKPELILTARGVGYQFPAAECRRARSAPSIARSRRFTARPPAYPTSDPSEPTTRWHGTTIGIGFEFSAPPAARDAFSLPARRATD